MFMCRQIFCISALLPPPPSSLLGSTFASATPLVQSLLNSSLLLNHATQLATAYLPLSTHGWAASEAAQAATASTPGLHAALARGEMFESASLLALQIHFATASYRSVTVRTASGAQRQRRRLHQRQKKRHAHRSVGAAHRQLVCVSHSGLSLVFPSLSSAYPRSLNMATAVGGVTQQSQANVLALKVVAELERAQLEAPAVASASRESSSAAAATPTIHTQAAAVALSLLGHWHSYPQAKLNVTLEPYSSLGSSLSATAAGCTAHCDRNRSLTESLHVLGNTEELSHAQVLQRVESQPAALYRHVSGSSRLNLPPSFSASFHELVGQGGLTALYRCQSLGEELRALGTWLASLNRGSVISSVYAGRDPDLPLDSAPAFLLSARRPRAHGDQSAEKAEHFHLSFTQEQMDEISECGVSLQNLAELY